MPFIRAPEIALFRPALPLRAARERGAQSHQNDDPIGWNVAGVSARRADCFMARRRFSTHSQLDFATFRAATRARNRAVLFSVGRSRGGSAWSLVRWGDGTPLADGRDQQTRRARALPLCAQSNGVRLAVAVRRHRSLVWLALNHHLRGERRRAVACRGAPVGRGPICARVLAPPSTIIRAQVRCWWPRIAAYRA